MARIKFDVGLTTYDTIRDLEAKFGAKSETEVLNKALASAQIAAEMSGDAAEGSRLTITGDHGTRTILLAR